VEFVAIDFETTGLSTYRDRVLEIGCIRFSLDGSGTEEFHSLVNPLIPVRASDIHGITDSDVRRAPTFADLAPRLIEFLEGRMLVAHNAPFDLGFFARELELCGEAVEDLEGLCTLSLVARTMPEAPRKLVRCCEFLGLEVSEGHHALNDAKMTASLARALLPREAKFEFPKPFAVERRSTRIVAGLSDLGRPVERQAVSNGESYLETLVARLPATATSSGPGAVAIVQYLDVLDRALRDRFISHSEADVLFETADSSGLGRTEIQTLHAAYFADLCRAALADNFVSSAERADLEKVATLLSIGDWSALLDKPTEISVWRGGIPAHKSSGEPITDSEFARVESGTDFSDHSVAFRLSGLSIVITGEFSEFSRDQGQEAVTRRGGKCPTSISKKTFALIAGRDAGPSKLEKAANLGVPVLNVSQFRYLLDTGLLLQSGS
jgi:DNA polymerase-3 subunit epsilon